MKGLRKAYRGERGFTLVELLVVVVILGVLAAVATLAVTKFIGSGNVEAANTELHQAQTAIAAAMADAGVGTVDATAAAWDGTAGVVEATSTAAVPVTYDAADYLMGRAFKATYQVDINGNIVAGTNVSWSKVTWSGNGWIKT